MTTIITSVNAWREQRKCFLPEQSVGFVPTMGNLHAGHVSLLQHSLNENDVSVLSLFVNPTQFNNPDDLARYPRTLEADIALARDLNIDYVFIPNVDEIYPDHYRYKITENTISQTLEGIHRPGHFDGVLTVVMKLFSLVKPHRAYFGEKDFQQLHLVKEMINAFFLDIELKTCPTLRRESGLPLSSRNNLLTEAELKLADEAAQLLHSDDNPDILRQHLAQKNIMVDYLEIWQNRLFSAIHIGPIRIIDNREITPCNFA